MGECRISTHATKTHTLSFISYHTRFNAINNNISGHAPEMSRLSRTTNAFIVCMRPVAGAYPYRPPEMLP